MVLYKFLGITAAILTTGAFVPQAYKTIKTRSTEDLSVITFLMMFAGTICWLFYGIYIADFPVIAANVVTAILSGIILCLKIFSGKKNNS